MPSGIQLANKIAHCRRLLNATRHILTTGDLKDRVKEYSGIPEDKTKMFVAFNEIVDSEGEENVRFTIIFTTPVMQARLSAHLIQDDATYR